jgi:uncharacterized membrane protein
MKLKRTLILGLIVFLPIFLAGCNSLHSVAYMHNGVTNNMTAIGPVSIESNDKRIFAKGEEGVRTALMAAAKAKYGNVRVDNVVDIEMVQFNGKRYYFSGIAVTYK